VNSRPKIIAPGSYLLAVDRDGLRVLRDALLEWEGPYSTTEGPRTPAEVEHRGEMLGKAADLLRAMNEELGGGDWS